MTKSKLLAIAFTALCFSASSLAADKTALEQAVAGEHRSTENRARDQYRHPVETLAFFGIEPDHTVVESWPGGGWYTQVLAPYLKENGKLIAAEPQPRESYHQMLNANPDVYSDVELVDLSSGVALAEPGSIDAIVDFRNSHNWIGSKERHDPLLRAWHKALKDDGIVGIVDHRRDPEGPATRGYLSEQQVIDIMDQYGFKLLERSEINANPKDSKDYPSGVWTLPPTLTLGDEDREKYLAIGESDRMTLIFTKK